MTHRKIGTWETKDYPFFGGIEEVKRAVMMRGSLTMTVASERWIRGKEDSNFCFCVFVENNITSYFIGIIKYMFTCEHSRLGERGLFAVLGLKEVEGVEMEHFDEHDIPHYRALNNLWRYKTVNAQKEEYICPLWEIAHKSMKCKDKSKVWFCGYM